MNHNPWLTYEGLFINHQYVDLNGKPVTKNPRRYPYSYDPYVTYKSNLYLCTENYDAVYSDRMMIWDYDKFSKACQEAFDNQGQLFSDRNPEDIQKFLQIYFNNPDIRLAAVMQGCNVATGFPYWIFYYGGVRLSNDD